MKCNILCFFDFVNYSDDVYCFKMVLKLCRFRPTSVVYTDNVPTQDDISGKDLIFIDFGGLSKGDEYYKIARHIENLIEFNHDKQFVFALTMPKWYYDKESIFEHPNVISFDKGDHENYYNNAFKLFR